MATLPAGRFHLGAVVENFLSQRLNDYGRSQGERQRHHDYQPAGFRLCAGYRDAQLATRQQ